MKPVTYFRLALLFPYILWVVGALIFLLIRTLEIPEAWNIVLMPFMFYMFGIILWFIPYTILAVGLGLWSRNKSTKSLAASAVLAPIVLSVLISLEAALVTLPADGIVEFMEDAISQSALVAVFTLFFGFLCVGVAAGVYKILRLRNVIAEKPPAQAL